MRSKRIKPPEGGKGGQAGEIKMVCCRNHRLPCMAPDPDRVMDMDKHKPPGNIILGGCGIFGSDLGGPVGHGAKEGPGQAAHRAAALRSKKMTPALDRATGVDVNSLAHGHYRPRMGGKSRCKQ